MAPLATSWEAGASPWAMPQPGTWLDFRNMTELVGRAWLQAFALAYRTTIDFDTVEALRGQDDASLDTNDDAAPALAKVGTTGRGQIWAWYRYSLEADDGERIVRPHSVAAEDPGRWHRQTLSHAARCGTTRTFQHVEFCDVRMPVVGAGKNDVSLWTRCRGQTPALFLSFTGDELEEASQTQAFHRVRLGFRARVLSANWRGGTEARMTPGRPEDQEADPGVYRLVGDLRDLIIKDNRLYPTLGTALLRTVLGPHRPLFDRDVDRIVCDSLDFTAVVSAWTPNTPCEVAKPWKLWVQLQDAAGRNAGPENQMEVP